MSKCPEEKNTPEWIIKAKNYPDPENPQNKSSPEILDR